MYIFEKKKKFIHERKNASFKVLFHEGIKMLFSIFVQEIKKTVMCNVIKGWIILWQF